ncbi:MAG: PTS sugar transporter subunit IIA [Thermoanaerobaculia bacterium]
MIGILILTHGDIAQQLALAAGAITSETERIEALGLGWSEDPDIARRRIEKAIAAVNGTGGVLVLTDMFGGTPSNIAFPFLQEGAVEIVTGVNLPMVLRSLATRRVDSLPVLARAVRERGRKAIEVASDYLTERTTAAAPVEEK